MRSGILYIPVFLFFAFAAKAQAPCDISVNVNSGCNPLPVSFTFTTTNTSTGPSYVWDFGDGITSTQSNPTHTYNKAGTYSVKVTVKFKDSTTCTVTLAKPITIFTNPNVDFIVNDNKPILLCERGDIVCFTDKSSAGSDKAPVRSWVWTFGDGSKSFNQNPCYAYADSGSYVVTLIVVDSNGCTNFIQKKILVRYTTDIGISVKPVFKVTLAYDCKKNIENIFFNNVTDTAGQFLTKFKWDYGDGAVDSCDLRTPGCISKFFNTQHSYSVAGKYKPSLYIENKYGCSNKSVIDTPVVLDSFKLGVQVFPNYPVCYSGDTLINFIAPFSTQAQYYMWDFGDPLDRATGGLPATSHTYRRPGIYTVSLKVKIRSCIYDTILCKKVVINGPIAKIMPIKGIFEPWDSVPPGGSFLIPPSKKASYFDTSCFGGASKPYYNYKNTLIKNGEPIYDTCRADTIRKLLPDSLSDCNGKKYPNYIISYQPHVKAYKDTFENVGTPLVWYKGNPVPSGNVYSNPPFINRPLYMDDTSLFSIRCKAPQKIKFTNFSDKYRGYDALDNYAPGYPDKCKNPVYPYASDSLSYFWDFREGSNTVSTKAVPDVKGRYSEEKLPTHLFQKDGCYWVLLTVKDPLTNCFDVDSVPVVLQQPDAGWAPQYSSIKNMTFNIQESLPANGPRRGMRIYEPPCIRDTQKIDLKETLPSCYKRNFLMVLDSAKQVVVCNKQTRWLWMSKDSIEKYFSYHFLYNYYANDTGWKTIGLVVTNNYNCSDTVWYHNYKYIHGLYPLLKLSAKHICAGDTLKMRDSFPEQLGIKSFKYFYAEEKDRGDTIARFTSDTVRYQVIKHPGLPNDTITSTVHNKDWGIDDGKLNFNYLTDTNKKVVPLPGHFTIISVMQSRWGCIDTAWTQVTVGHYSDFSADNNVLCTNDTAHFYGLGQYFVPFAGKNSGYDNRLFWENPDSVRHGRKTKIPEQMQWDLDGDGNIDYTGTRPSFVYKKPGSYTVTLYTTDSSGCVQKLSRKDFIKVIDATAYFSVLSPGDTRYCSGSHFFEFQDSSFVNKSFVDSLNLYRIYSWTWDFGDGTSTKPIIDPAKKNASHIYVENGDYTVTLTVATSPGGGSGLHGCSNTFKKVVHILGPTSHFTIIGPDKGCVPFTLTVRDESKNAKVKREWRLGDGTTVTSSGDSIIKLIYLTPGVFCPQFFVADSIIDSKGDTLYCVDTFPEKCKLKVEVYKINVQALTVSDTLLCAGRDSVFFRSTPDTGYKTWTIDYGNGDNATNIKPAFKYRYDKTGRYHAVISGTGALCPDTSSVNVHVVDIKADFNVDTAKKDTPVFSFKNVSTGGVLYHWDFGDGSPGIDTKSSDEISHEFLKAGKSTICLTAYNEKNCSDKICKDITIDTFLMIPNVFTPNGDGYNNHYVITIYGNKLYDLDIFNRWGEKVFHSDDKNHTWDGINHSNGKLYADGAYYAVFKYRFVGSKVHQATQAVTLIRRN